VCSIFGFNDIEKSHLSDLFMNSMRHRGPDHEGTTTIGGWVIGHQRLSIIDTSDDANQPMEWQDGVIAFNGEIYNYKELSSSKLSNIKLNTHSDTEVLLRCLHRYGLSILHELNGMFAFSWFDAKRKKMILCRDRFGVKPIHWMKQDGVIYYASEIRPLAKINHTSDFEYDVIDAFVEDTATDYNELTFLKGVYQVPPGHYLEIDASGDVRCVRWYKGSDFLVDQGAFVNEESILDYYEDILTDAVRIRLRSDVPVCITLSGGLDSTIIYTLAKENLSSSIKPFHFMHPGSLTDESHIVSQLVERFGDSFCSITAPPQEGFEELELAMKASEFPIWNSSALGYLRTYENIKNSGFKVVLEGHGSDEQLGGYPYMIQAACNDYIKSGNYGKAIETHFIAHMTENSALQQKRGGAKTYLLLLKTLLKCHLTATPSFDEVVDNAFHYKILPIVFRAFDRLTMSQSVESRAPFMDYRIVELNRQLPLDQKISDIGSKAILRKLLKRKGLNFIYENRAKMGFASDLPVFFNDQDNKSKIAQLIDGPTQQRYMGLKRSALRSLDKDYIIWSDIDPIWKCFALQWMEQYYTNISTNNIPE